MIWWNVFLDKSASSLSIPFYVSIDDILLESQKTRASNCMRNSFHEALEVFGPFCVYWEVDKINGTMNNDMR